MLRKLKKLDKPITCTNTGMGAMGKGLLYQLSVTPGIELVAVANRTIDRAVEAAEAFDVPYRVVDSEGAAQDAIAEGLLAIAADGKMIAGLEGVDCHVESTCAIEAGLEFATAGLESGKHVIMRNSEADLAFGPHLLKLAESHGVIYSSADGDQHVTINRLVEELELWGFELVMGGNIKGFLNRYADPVSIKHEAEKRNFSPQMCAAFTDGSKLCIEMALLANALDMRTDVVGMHGPTARHANEAVHKFDFEAMLDKSGGKPIVDYILQAQPGGGVFAIGYCDHPYQQGVVKTLKLGDGPYYCFYRPYHLCSVESAAMIGEAVLHDRDLLQPRAGFVTQVYAYAKKDLKPGDVLDDIGGHCCYGMIDNCGPGGTHPHLPICLAHDVKVTQPVKQDQPIRLTDVDLPRDRLDVVTYGKCIDGDWLAAVAP